MSWRLAKSLEKLRAQINAVAPRRNKLSDGTIGDQAHSNRPSDHNPNAAGVVTAMDITHDPVNGVDGNVLSSALKRDSRVKYIIFNGEIWKARTGKWEKYRGSNAHRKHVHVSVKPDVYDSLAPWVLSVTEPSNETVSQTQDVESPSPASLPVLRFGHKGEEVKRVQSLLKAKGYQVSVDSIFGNETLKALQKFQRDHGLKDDGICSSRCWAELLK